MTFERGAPRLEGDGAATAADQASVSVMVTPNRTSTTTVTTPSAT
ncbi:hypothetical protein [Sphaerisporangium fuscum]|nr:hypothetical protein [Sphaerisporangium fuscum]